ncbi:MAG: PC4/YdbC family ssDNA-binding protein [Oscillospiraceae bacterium]|nr:PC4/YdbC family ssDNA-binding protein [Oscillospiraceae bacterium]
MEGKSGEIKFEVVRHLGVLSTGTKGWRKEVNFVRWNGRDPKLDIRDWSEGRETMSKGITFSKEEFEALKSIILDVGDIAGTFGPDKGA